MGKLSLAVFLYLIFLTISYSSKLSASGKPPTISIDCVAEERRALLNFKQSLSDSFNRLLSWNHTDCCKWDGVTCDKITGHVVVLDLRYRYVKSRLEMVNPSLSELKYLRYLDLSWNDFQLSTISAFLGSMKYLQHLDLSSANFSGVIPHNLGNLSRLSHLDLSGNDFQRSQIPAFLGSMKYLQHLDLSRAKFSGVIPHNLGNLSSLRNLNLHTMLEDTIGELEVHDLIWASNLTLLESLDLSGINLSQTKDPNRVLSMLPALTYLYLGRCEIGNTNFQTCAYSSPLANNKYLDLQGNLIYEKLPCFILNMPSLEILDLSKNRLSGSILTSLIGNLSALTYLDLSHNAFTGPISLGQLSNFWSIDISYNSFNDTLSEAHFAKLSKLYAFRANSNMLHLSVGFDWVPPFQLGTLSLRSVKINDQFPQWLRTQKNLNQLDLSDCGIWGTLPPSLCEMRGLRILDLSNNHLSGSLLDCWSNLPNLYALRLSSNEFTGVLPNSIGEASALIWLQLANNGLIGQLPSTLKNCTKLLVLDVGNNKITGNVSNWNLFNLNVLRLRSNAFYGEMSIAFCRLPNLQIMDIANNRVTGKIPNCLHNPSELGLVVGFSSWSLIQVIKGIEREYKVSIFMLMFNLNLSNNSLHGDIPSELTNLSSMFNLNLSHNYLEGVIPTMIENLKSLESLDLSSNHLFGAIPQSLSNLYFLSVLNLSHNNLFGQIPMGNQLQALNDPSIYEGNLGLCGQPLPNKCPNNKSSSNSTDIKNQEEGEAEHIYFYAVVACGFVVGFWGFIGVLVLKRRWRQIYFYYIEVAIDRIFRL